MGPSALLIAITFVTPTHTLSDDEIGELESTFHALWGTGFAWGFDDLPLKGNTPKYRVPYSGYYYPDKDGGTVSSLRKYDQAFNYGRQSAAGHEKWDTTAFKEPVSGLLGAFGISKTPEWYGHCNGWTSAAIRHAEPRTSVIRNGVTFSPADIKGLLAELYVYNHHIVLSGDNEKPITAPAFHAVITNWLGRKEYPLGIEVDPSEEKWNYPAFGYAASFAKHSERRVEVNMNIAYAKSSNREWEKSPRIKHVKFFHYLLDLNHKGEIIGGRFFNDSESIDMLWVPMRPKAAGLEGNERGNPYLDVDEVLAIWRDSVPQQIRRQWNNVDPIAEDKFEPIPVITADIPLVRQEKADRLETNPTTRRSDASSSPPRHFSATESTDDPLDVFTDLLNRQPPETATRSSTRDRLVR